MSDDMVMHFSSNSSNQSDHSLPDKIAKLEARLTGKTASSSKPLPQQQPQQQQQLSVWSSAVKVVASAPAGSSEVSISDSDDEVALLRMFVFGLCELITTQIWCLLLSSYCVSYSRCWYCLRTQEISSSELTPKSVRKLKTLTTTTPLSLIILRYWFDLLCS